MDIAKKILDKGIQSGKKVAGGTNFLQLMKKDEQGVARSTGPHKVKILRDETKMGEDYHTKIKRQEMHIWVEERGVEKLWKFSVFSKNQDGTYDPETLNYLIPKVAELNVGDWVILEAKKSGLKSFIDVQKVGVETATVQLDEGSEATVGGVGEGEDFPSGEDLF